MSVEPLPMPFEELLDDLAGTIDRVVRENVPVVVEHNGNRVRLVPERPRKRQPRARSQADLDAFLTAAGSMRGLIDADALKHDVYAARGSHRPPVEL